MLQKLLDKDLDKKGGLSWSRKRHQF